MRNQPIKNSKKDDNKPVDYVLYLRKSTESEDRQVKSIDDQRQDCLQYAKRQNLKIIETITESGSAKTSNNRPHFNQMIEGLKTGRYNGIIAWHPDRLSRNMYEAGIIIDMLDDGTIRDLKFPTMAFSSDASGKMLLGILFVMSKQYSEHLSESVSRGIKTNLEQGKSGGQRKWGYRRNQNGIYEKDENFTHIQKAWQMRVSGATYEEILRYLIQNDIHRVSRTGKKERLSGKHSLTTMFGDPFYYGILVQANQEVDLRELLPDFEPLVSEEDFQEVQVLSKTSSRLRSVSKRRKTFLPLSNGFVQCGVCGGTMSVEASKSKSGEHYLYFRCHNKECSREKKGIRAGVVFKNLCFELDKLKFTHKEYKDYFNTINIYTNEIITNLRKKKHQLMGYKNSLEKRSSLSEDKYINLDKDAPQSVRQRLSTEIEDLHNEIEKIKNEIVEINNKLQNSNKIAVSQEEFSNTMNQVADKIRAGDIVVKDILTRKIVSNIIISNENSPSFIWKEPFETMLKLRKSSRGWG